MRPIKSDKAKKKRQQKLDATARKRIEDSKGTGKTCKTCGGKTYNGSCSDDACESHSLTQYGM